MLNTKNILSYLQRTVHVEIRVVPGGYPSAGYSVRETILPALLTVLIYSEFCLNAFA